MKNFILGVLTCALLSFTSIETGIITVKPATPKSIFCKHYYDNFDKATNDIKYYSTKGYILKSCERVGGEVSGTIIIVMEKY